MQQTPNPMKAAQFIWNRFTLQANARALFAKAIWAGVDCETAVITLTQFVRLKGIVVPPSVLINLWQSVEAELSTFTIGGVN